MSRLQSKSWREFQTAIVKPIAWIGLSVWSVACVCGYWSLMSYSSTAGESSDPEATWPRETQIVADPARANLAVFAHPRCPCSRATLCELEEILARCNGQIAVHVLFLKPSLMPAGWEVSDLWHQAASIPGVHLQSDENGRETRRFGAMTSGQVFLYDQSGHLKFSGGITVARGHRGESPGHQAIVDWLTHGTAERSAAAVFGCPLFSNRDVAVEEKR